MVCLSFMGAAWDNGTSELLNHGCDRILLSATQGFEQTGLGNRVATLFVRAFGKSTLGLAYGLSVAEALVAPAMPSTTARAGGIFMPIINSLALASGSKPGAFASSSEPRCNRCNFVCSVECGRAQVEWQAPPGGCYA